MNSFFVLSIACSAAMMACQSVSQRPPKFGTAASAQQAQTHPARDFRELKKQLKGKPASAVIAALGKPARVWVSGASESWDYINAAYDPVSRRPMRNLSVWFRQGIVDYTSATF